jgi:hypothetical protein
MDWFWHALLVCFVIIPATLLWIAIIIELIRRRDLSTWRRIGWLLGILIFPIIGSLTYLIITWWHADAATDLGAAPQAAAGVPEQPETIADLTRLDQLRRSGMISEADFEAGRRRVLEGGDAAAPPGRHASPDTEVGT